ncbi:MAG: hypothetical protein FWF99_03455 [Desulfovibrionaceae bacterium]|nr:hypothetical protein [Desulfovibrionaceae bacterium]
MKRARWTASAKINLLSALAQIVQIGTISILGIAYCGNLILLFILNLGVAQV